MVELVVGQDLEADSFSRIQPRSSSPAFTWHPPV